MSESEKPKKLVKRRVEIVIGEGRPPFPLGFIDVWMYPDEDGVDESTVWRLKAFPRQRHKIEDMDSYDN